MLRNAVATTSALVLALAAAAVATATDADSHEESSTDLDDRAFFNFPGRYRPQRRPQPWGSDGEGGYEGGTGGGGGFGGGTGGGGGWGWPGVGRPRPTPMSQGSWSGEDTNRGGGGGGWGWPMTVGSRRPSSTPPPRRPAAGANRGTGEGAGEQGSGEEVCGRTAGFNRVIRGEESWLGQFPWQAALLYRRGGSGAETVQCGGALVSPRYVVTAAHCLHPGVIRDWRLTKVRLGEWDRTTDRDCDEVRCAPPTEDFRPEARIIHPAYTPTPRGGSSGPRNEGDIALIRLNREAPYTDFIRPVCLPWGDQAAAGDLAGQKLIVSGWGRTETTDGSDRLLFAALPALPLNDCARRLRVPLAPTQLCAGAEGRDSCKGDSGGPLLRAATTPDGSDLSYQLVGVVAFGPEACGTVGLPGAYTRVAAFLPWLRENMRS